MTATETTEVVVIGAGQSGIATSEHLTAAGIPHIVLERDRIAEKWRTGRWDSLCANGPAWHDRFPNLTFADPTPSGAEPIDGEAFAHHDRVAQYFEDYAAGFAAPVRTGVEVVSVSKRARQNGYLIVCADGATIVADHVVSATGPFQVPVIPPVISQDVADSCGITQIHSADYDNPQSLPDGGVLVVGAGSSGLQIAAELNKAGKDVTLAVGAHDRPPRRYRGRDNVWWLGVLGKWDMAAPPVGAEHVTIAVTGAEGGYTVDFRDLAADGIHLVGRAENCDADGILYFRDDLADNIHAGDRNLLGLYAEADAYIEVNGLDLPEEPEAWVLGPDPVDVTDPVLSLDLARSGIRTVVWATGYGVDYSWLNVDGVTDDRGRPVHQRGVSPANGVYFVGLPWLSRRGSSFIWGCWHDAKYVVDEIMIQRGYAAYTPEKETAR
ncbi:Flavin-containing monooxygenase FMO [Corynebacterium glyciniphilum AJ 3170]|uniref:Flavin-containing monooxygenase FMO n=1 Tax=Corynebacterium glyciniphilum AJ 3170 TaxID=1404245 RepID=X5DI38_9CORY|nr:NAD(P)/FAD-dependent oxidoreductase [Corynebacterium glyciniphilum]AHW62713.1 Flavin-containing monooxygenase FMO [Corynebacterium glyciniphilum AJ 3170]